MSSSKKQQLFTYFGTAAQCQVDHKTPEFPLYCKGLQKSLNITGLLILKQEHGINGVFIDKNDNFTGTAVAQQEGDFIVTNATNVAIGVLTADCLPIIFYDPVTCTVAAIHAGWKGSAAGVAIKALEMMQQKVSTNPQDLQVFFGPAAHSCCYQVKEDFLEHFKNYPWLHTCLQERDGSIFFDLVTFNNQQLQACGIATQQINTNNSKCTMCVPGYHSFRRDGAKACRQITAAWTLR